MITTLNKFRRRVEHDVDVEANATHKTGRRLNPAKLPSTQDAIAVVATQDGVLILRNGAVVAAMAFGSMNDV